MERRRDICSREVVIPAIPVEVPNDLAGLAALLERHGFLAAEEEAVELLVCAARDGTPLEEIVSRRLTGEPLAWITGTVSFCGLQLAIHPAVYVPRRQSEQLARRSVERLPVRGIAIDLCTGTGAIATVLMNAKPDAHVLASDLDERAVACAAANGVEVYPGDLFAPLPSALESRVDLVVAIVPYVPSGELSLLQRDTFTFEPTLWYDGGADGCAVLRRVMNDSRRFLRPGGALLLEVGGEQAELLRPDLMRLGYRGITIVRDEEGDVRGVEATLQQ